MTDGLAKVIRAFSDLDLTVWVLTTSMCNQVAERRTLMRLMRYALAAIVWVAPKTSFRFESCFDVRIVRFEYESRLLSSAESG